MSRVTCFVYILRKKEQNKTFKIFLGGGRGEQMFCHKLNFRKQTNKKSLGRKIEIRLGLHQVIQSVDCCGLAQSKLFWFRPTPVPLVWAWEQDWEEAVPCGHWGPRLMKSHHLQCIQRDSHWAALASQPLSYTA